MRRLFEGCAYYRAVLNRVITVCGNRRSRNVKESMKKELFKNKNRRKVKKEERMRKEERKKWDKKTMKMNGNEIKKKRTQGMLQ